MDATWPLSVKIFYAVACLVLFTLAMLLISHFIVAPMQDWMRVQLERLPTWAIISLIVPIFPAWAFVYWRMYLRHGVR